MKKPLHMNLSRIVLITMGVWPVKWTGIKLTLYNVYFFIGFPYFIATDVVMQGAAAFRKTNDMLETASNIGVSLLYAMNIYRVVVCKSQAMTKAIAIIEWKENIILEHDSEEIKTIYRDTAKANFWACLYYGILGTTAIVLYMVNPLIKTYLLADEFGNKNQVLMYESWFPFDPYKYFFTTFFIQLYAAFWGYAVVVFLGIFYLSLLTYCIGQLKILQAFLGNIAHYSKKYATEHGVSQEQAEEIFVKMCIKEHQDLIGFIQDINDTIKTYVLLEFGISSFQLSLVVFQVQQLGSGPEKIRAFLYLSLLIVQLFLFYWNAHRIITEGTELGQVIFENDWLNFNIKTQKMLMMVLMRTQKPVGVTIGTFRDVNVGALITNTPAPATYYRSEEKKQEFSDRLSSSFQYFDKLNKEGCENKVLCELLVSASFSKNAEEYIRSLLDNFIKQEDLQSKKEDLLKIFEAVKKQDCSPITCETMKIPT